MSNQKAEAARNAKSNTRQDIVKYNQINIDSTADYCHRSSDYLKDENLLPLAENIVAEGLQTPLLLKEAGEDEHGEKQFVLLGGHRRRGAIGLAIKRKLDAKRIHEDMEIPAIIVIPDEGQAETEFAKDVMIKSIGDNANRRDLTEDERLRTVRKCRDMGIPDPRAASAMGLGETQYRRLACVVETPWLLELVQQNKIGMTHASALRMACKNPLQHDLLQAGIDSWITRMAPVLEQERANQRKIGKDLSGSANTLKKYLDTKLIKHWIKCIEGGTELTEPTGVEFGVLVDRENGTVTVPAININIREHSREDLIKLIRELNAGAEQAIELVRQQELLSASRLMSPEERSTFMKTVLSEYDSKLEAQEQAERGRPPRFSESDGVRKQLAELGIEEQLSTDGASSEGEDWEGA